MLISIDHQRIAPVSGRIDDPGKDRSYRNHAGPGARCDRLRGMPKSRLLVGLCAGVISIAFESMAVTTAMPAAAADLGQLDRYAWVFSLFSIAMLASTVLGGRLADRHGPFLPLLLGAASFAAGLLSAGLAPTMSVLLLGRTLQGLGAGAINIGWAVTLAHAFTEAERPRLMGVFSTCWMLPSFVGAPLAAWITTTWGWHAVFLSVLPLVVAAALLCGPVLLSLRHDAGHDPAPVPVWAAAVASAAAAAVQYAGQRAAETGGLSWSIVGVGASGLVGLIVAVPRLMPVGLLHSGPLLPAIVTKALLAGPYFVLVSFFPLMMVQLRGWSTLQAGSCLIVGSVGWTTGAWLQSRSTRLPRGRVIVVGMASLTVAVAILATLAWLPQLWAGWVVAAWLLGGLGMGLATTSVQLAVMSLSNPGQQGRTNAAEQVTDTLGSCLLVAVAGGIYAAWLPSGALSTGYGWMLVTMVGFGLLGLVVAWRIGPLRDLS